MDGHPSVAEEESLSRIEQSYRSSGPGLVARLRRAGRSLQEAEDLVHDAYAEVLRGIDLVPDIRNVPAWISSLLNKRLIDSWRRERTRRMAGETTVSQETLEEIIGGAGLDPHDSFVRESLVEALDAAIKALPATQRRVIEAQVFGGLSFKQISEQSGEGMDTLAARKRYALAKLSRALRHWIEG